MKKTKTLELFFIFLLSLSYFIYSSVINISYYYSIGIGIIITMLFLLALRQNIGDLKHNKIFKKSIIYILIPLLLIPWSLLLVSYAGNGLLFKKFLARTLLYTMTSIEGIALFGLYKEKAVDVFFKSAVLNYFIIILMFIYNNGIMQIFTTTYNSIFADSPVKSILEAHEVTFVFGICLIYYLFNGYKKNKSKIITCTIFSIMGYKRIMVLAIAVAFVFGLIFLKRTSKKQKKIAVLSFCIFLIISASFIYWLISIKNNTLGLLSSKYNINFMGRLNIYSLISREYSITPLFLGKGLGYISYWGEVFIQKTNATALHCGIVQMYVENGFLLFFLYLFNMICLNSKRINKINRNNAIIYLCICIYTLICWFTDNIASYYNYLVAFSLITISLMNINHIEDNN